MKELYMVRVWVKENSEPTFLNFLRSRQGSSAFFFEDEVSEGCLTSSRKEARKWREKFSRQFKKYPTHNWGRPELLHVRLEITHCFPGSGSKNGEG